MRNKKIKEMLKLIVIIMILVIASLSGCRKIKKDSSSGMSSSTILSESVLGHPEETKLIPEENDEVQKNTDAKQSKITEQQTSGIATDSNNSNVSAVKKKESKNSSASSSMEKKSEATKSSAPTESKPAELKPVIKNAGPGDAREIADKIIQHINEYRIIEGVSAADKLTGLTVYAEYRSRQLVTNFNHDTLDERAAATALKYGMYIVPSEFGAKGQPYYAACVSEAIAQSGYIGNVEYIAQRFAALAKNSPGHWSYVGSNEYPYIAVGITYNSGTWYCDIAMSQTNEYEK